MERPTIFEIILNKNENQQKLFPNDQCGDVKLVFKDKTYSLQKIYLDAFSEYLKRMYKDSNNVIGI